MFAQQGMGKMIYDSILSNDFNLALSGLLFATLITLLANLAADLAYGWLDPQDLAQMTDLAAGSRARAPAPQASTPRNRSGACAGAASAAIDGGMASLVVLAILVLFCLSAYPLESYLGLDSNTTDLLVAL